MQDDDMDDATVLDYLAGVVLVAMVFAWPVCAILAMMDGWK